MRNPGATNGTLAAVQAADTKQPYAVVIGLDSIQGLQAARILARRGVPVVALADDLNHPCCRTTVCERIIDAPTTNEKLIDALEDLGVQLPRKAVLFPCEDANVLQVSRNRDRLEQWYHVVLPPADVVELLMDKIQFYTYAQEHGFPVPRTYVVDSQTSLDAAADALTFPCVLKPHDSAAPKWEANTMFKAIKLSNAEELKSVHDQYKRWTDCFIVQEWIEGSDEDLCSCNCYFNANGEASVTFVARKLRQWPPQTGISCLGEECRNDVVLNEALRLFRSLYYRGLGYLEMKRDARTGKHVIVEPNIGRPTGRSAIAEAGGVELLYSMYCDAVDWPMPENRKQKYEGTKWIHLRKDLQSSFYYWRRGELTFRNWWQSWRGKKTCALWSWRDPGPFLADWIHAIRVYLSPVERKKRDYRNLAEGNGTTRT